MNWKLLTSTALLAFAATHTVLAVPAGQSPEPTTSWTPTSVMFTEYGQAIYDAVRKSVVKHPHRSPVPLAYLATTGKLENQVIGYGSTAIFGDAMADLIETAEEEVFLSSYIMAKNNPTNTGLVRGLKRLNDKCRRQGCRVRVRIIFDPYGALAFQREIPEVQALIPGRHDVRDPAHYQLPTAEELEYLDYEVKTLHTGLLGITHSKMMVIDGEKTFFGSKNIEGDDCQEYMMELHGAVARVIRMDLADMWSDPLPKLNTPPRPVAGAVPMVVMGRRQKPGLLSFDNNTPQVVGWMTAMDIAKESVYIQSLNVVTKDFINKILETVRRGVQVNVVTSFSQQDTWERLNLKSVGSNRDAADKLYDALKKEPEARKNLNVCWWIGNRITGSNPEPRASEWSHAKVMIVDRRLAIVGSANHDPQSWYRQREQNLAIDDAATAEAIYETFMNDYHNYQFCSQQRA